MKNNKKSVICDSSPNKSKMKIETNSKSRVIPNKGKTGYFKEKDEDLFNNEKETSKKNERKIAKLPIKDIENIPNDISSSQRTEKNLLLKWKVKSLISLKMNLVRN